MEHTIESLVPNSNESKIRITLSREQVDVLENDLRNIHCDNLANKIAQHKTRPSAIIEMKYRKGDNNDVVVSEIVVVNKDTGEMEVLFSDAVSSLDTQQLMLFKTLRQMGSKLDLKKIRLGNLPPLPEDTL